MDEVSERVAKLEVISDNTSKAIETMSRRMDDGLKELRSELRDARSQADSNFRWIVGIQITTLLAMLGLLAKAAKLL